MPLVLAALLLALALAQPPARAHQAGEPPIVRMARGHVVAVDAARRLVVLKHEEIPSLGMPEMQMEYVVPEDGAFPDVAAGDRVRFAVVRIDGRHLVTRVEPLARSRGGAGQRGRGSAVRSDP